MDYYIKPGFWINTKQKVKGALSFRKVLGQYLTIFGVPYSDPCCTSTTATTPVGTAPADTAITNAINAATFASGVATITPAGGAILHAGSFYVLSGKLYYATANNVVMRFTPA